MPSVHLRAGTLTLLLAAATALLLPQPHTNPNPTSTSHTFVLMPTLAAAGNGPDTATGTGTGAGSNHPDPAGPNVALEALKRLKGIDLEANPTLKTALLNVLETVRGTPAFVEIVRDFGLQGQNDGLLEFAIRHPNMSPGADAMRWILDSGDLKTVRDALESPDPDRRIAAVTVLGASGHPATVALLRDLVEQRHHPIAVRRQAVRSVARTRDGAELLLRMAADESVDEALEGSVRSVLRQAAWPDVREKSRALFPAPPTRDGKPLPPISELITQTGNPEKGEGIFRRPEVACSQCHKVRGAGTDFGPDLSEIGAKLGPEAIYEAILNPNAGISFGYEAWEIELADGGEWIGLVVSETDEAVTVKSQGGIISRFPKSAIVHRSQMPSSIMPEGLQQALTARELIDLVAYLQSLRPHESAPESPR